MAIPEQVPQSFHVGLSLVVWGKERLEGVQASHDLLDMVHAHREMKPIQDSLHWAARGRAHQGRQRWVAIADCGDRVALSPALTLQRRTQLALRNS